MRVPWQRGAEQSGTQDDHLWGGIFDLRHHRWWLWASSWPNWAALRAIIFDEVNIFSSPDQQYLVNFVLRHVKFFISNLCSIGPIFASILQNKDVMMITMMIMMIMLLQDEEIDHDDEIRNMMITLLRTRSNVRSWTGLLTQKSTKRWFGRRYVASLGYYSFQLILSEISSFNSISLIIALFVRHYSVQIQQFDIGSVLRWSVRRLVTSTSWWTCRCSSRPGWSLPTWSSCLQSLPT